MNDALIIQQAYSNSPYAPMLKSSFSRHVDYSLAHGFDLLVTISDIKNQWQSEGCWTKVWLAQKALLDGYRFVAWIDADAYIHKVSEDLRNALPDGGIGCTWHTSPCDHWNTGVMYFRNTPRTLEFIDCWLKDAPGNDGWHEQSIYNRMAHSPEWADVCRTVHARWNCTFLNNETPDFVVRAFHGYGDPAYRLRKMQESLGQ